MHFKFLLSGSFHLHFRYCHPHSLLPAFFSTARVFILHPIIREWGNHAKRLATSVLIFVNPCNFFVISCNLTRTFPYYLRLVSDSCASCNAKGLAHWLYGGLVIIKSHGYQVVFPVLIAVFNCRTFLSLPVHRTNLSFGVFLLL